VLPDDAAGQRRIGKDFRFEMIRPPRTGGNGMLVRVPSGGRAQRAIKRSL
jgi:hypothetical protein